MSMLSSGSAANGALPLAAQGNALIASLEPGQEFDVATLDNVVNIFYAGRNAEEQKLAGNILTQFQEHPESWSKVDRVLETARTDPTKFIALQILEGVIKTRWKILPPAQRTGIREFIVNIIIKNSSDDESLHKQRTYLNKLNMVLVQILKQEWPHNWPDFIPSIVASSKANLSLCENNMAILKLLSEEIFDFSAEQMTQQKTKNLKQQMCGEFSEIFTLCHAVLDKASKPSLIRATLETLLRFLNWIPLGYIFETNIVEVLHNRFFGVPAFRNVTLKCLTEIGSLAVPEQYEQQFIVLYNMVITSIMKTIPVQTDLAEVYENANDDDQQFIQNLGLFLTAFFSQHLATIEAGGDNSLLINGHWYLLRISLVKEREVFKVCLDYWYTFVQKLYEECQNVPLGDTPLLNLTPGALAPSSILSSLPVRRNRYLDILSALRTAFIERMVKPEEVLIVENDEGEIVREFVKESDTIQLYKSMKDVLVFLTHLDSDNMESIMLEKLNKQVDGSEWGWERLNQLCWAIGSISGAMPEDVEKRFLVTVIKELLGLCEMKRGKDNKAVVASNIMYIVGQYPRFLKAHWKFLKTVVNKLFEFMHETHEGVQDMACDTFIKISQKCKRHFVMQQAGEVQPYIEEILTTIDQITSDLAPQQVHTFYEAVGYMISAQPHKIQQERLIIKLMELPNVAWDNLIAQAARDINILNNPDNLKVLGNILKTNVSACTSVGAPFIVQLGRIYIDMLSLYKAVSTLVSQECAEKGAIATRTPRVRQLRTIKKEVLKVIENYVSRAEDLRTVLDNMIQPLLEAVLLDYKSNTEPARDAEVLNVMATIVSTLKNLITDRVPNILDAIFECTLSMISNDFEEYPEHRVGFFRLIRAINQYCFDALWRMPAPQFKLIIDSIIWAFKHTMRDIAEIGLATCQELITNFTHMPPDVKNPFFNLFYLSTLQDIFYVLTDTAHKSGFKYQCQVLAQLLQLVATNEITTPLYQPGQTAKPNAPNVEFVGEYIMNMLASAFSHLQPAQIKAFVDGMFRLYQDQNAFKLHVRDFLIQLKEFAGDNADLFLDEREAEAEEKRREEFESRKAVPGLLKPSERVDEGMLD